MQFFVKNSQLKLTLREIIKNNSTNRMSISKDCHGICFQSAKSIFENNKAFYIHMHISKHNSFNQFRLTFCRIYPPCTA